MYRRAAQVGSAALMAIALGVLAGCAPSPAPATESSPSPAPSTPTSTPSATPTPSSDPVADSADPSTWTISDSAVGPIELGGDFDSTLASLPAPWSSDAESCSYSAWWRQPEGLYGMYFFRSNESDTAPIKEVAVYGLASPDGGPKTAEGLGAGSTRADVLAAYPDAEEGTAEIGTESWLRLPSSGDAHVFFQFPEGQDIARGVVVTTDAEPAYEVCG